MTASDLPHKNIRRKVVERFLWKLEPMVRLECGHTTAERVRWVGGVMVPNQSARCWDCETERDRKASEAQ